VPQRRSVLRVVIACALAGLCISRPVPAFAHDIYSHLTNKSGRPCCDGSDCRPAQYRINTFGIEMLIQDRWVHIPSGTIEYRAIGGDTGETSGGHWCGEAFEGGFITYCAFLPPILAYRK
jgi:hypothetical protein